jgi:putative ABC transport system ATP-binding protein
VAGHERGNEPSSVPVLSFEDVCVRFGDVEVLRSVTAEVSDACVTVLTGPSGSGKTTLLRLCNRLEVPTTGTVRFRGDDVAALDPLALRRRVGMVFQRPTLFPGTIAENFVVAAPHAGDHYERQLSAVGLPAAWLDRPADDLSGGEAQRACLARTLLTRPEVLLMDEPTSSLDPAATRALEELGTGLAGAGLAVVWVSHDLAQVRRIADHCIVLRDGRVADTRHAEEYLADRDAPGDGGRGGGP